MLGARRRKSFAVVVWVKKTDTFDALRAELVAVAGNAPEESAEYEGKVDFHWWFEMQAASNDWRIR